MSKDAYYYQEQVRRLNNIGIMISKEKDVDKLLNYILDESLQLTNSDAGSIYVREEIDGEDFLVFKCSLNRSSDVDFVGKTLPFDESSISGMAATTGEVVIIGENENSELRINKTFDDESSYYTQNMIVVPMKDEVNKVVGVFQILNKKDEITNLVVDYDEDDIELINSLASQTAILLNRLRLNKMLERNVGLTRTTLIKFFNGMKQAMSVIGDDILKEQHEFKALATTDELTGLLLRAEGLSFLEKQIEFSALSGKKLVIAFIDINDLKKVNDLFGHAEGDYYIKKVVEIITRVAREGDFMFRYGGDEFILCVNNADLDAAMKLKTRLDKAFEMYNRTTVKEYKISASFGFAEYSYRDGKTLEQLIEIADKNMYKDKSTYRSKYL